MRIIERVKKFMNTDITIRVVQNDAETVAILDSIEAAFGEFNRIVEQYTRFNENSELSNLNRNSGSWVSISQEFFELIQKMLSLAEKTNGAFDPTIIDFLEVYGYDKNYDFSRLDNKAKLQEFVLKIKNTRATWREIEMSESERRVKLAQNQKIDLGGIGKGYAVDCAAKHLLKVTKDFLIDAGGDVYGAGNSEHKKPWRVALKALQNDTVETVGFIDLHNQALASSGSWARKVKQFHHLIDPTTGKPAKRSFSTVFTLADMATIADGWATALFITGKETKASRDSGVKAMFY